MVRRLVSLTHHPHGARQPAGAQCGKCASADPSSAMAEERSSASGIWVLTAVSPAPPGIQCHNAI